MDKNLIKIKLDEMETSLKSLRALIESDEHDMSSNLPDPIEEAPVRFDASMTFKEHQQMSDNLYRQHVDYMNTLFEKPKPEPELNKRIIANVDTVYPIPIPDFTK